MLLRDLAVASATVGKGKTSQFFYRARKVEKNVCSLLSASKADTSHDIKYTLDEAISVAFAN
ncbi:hypothetical protein FACS189419_05480 [Planctomycetales bacterium]|nr:hypothetical protein FACS189419_05480 [Planctomycetales bacterium]